MEVSFCSAPCLGVTVACMSRRTGSEGSACPPGEGGGTGVPVLLVTPMAKPVAISREGGWRTLCLLRGARGQQEGLQNSGRGGRRGPGGASPPPITPTPAPTPPPFLTLVHHQPSWSHHLGVWLHKDQSPDPPRLPPELLENSPQTGRGSSYGSS